jgi:hypothetical protein
MTDYTRQIIDYAQEDNGVEFRNALYASIHDKLTAHIDAKKQEIAQNLISPEIEDDGEQEQSEEQPQEVENT